MYKTLPIKIVLTIIIFFCVQFTDPVTAQSLFGFKYIFKVDKYNKKYSLDTDAYRNANGLVNMDGYSLIKTALVKRGTALVPTFTTGTTTSGKFNLISTSSKRRIHNQDGSITTITTTYYNPGHDRIKGIRAKGTFPTVPAVHGVAPKPTRVDEVITSVTFDPSITKFGSDTTYYGKDTIIKIYNNCCSVTTITKAPTTDISNKCCDTIKGLFITVTNAIGTNGHLSWELINGNKKNDTIFLNAVFTSITPNHGAFNYSTHPDSIINHYCSFTGTDPDLTKPYPNGAYTGGMMTNGIYIDTEIVIANKDTIFRYGLFNAVTTRYYSDITAATHYADELSFHPYVWRANARGYNKSEYTEDVPFRDTRRIQDQLLDNSVAYDGANHANDYNLVFSMNYNNNPYGIRLQYSSIPFFHLRFRSGYFGLITVPLAWSIKENYEFSNAANSFLNAGFSMGKVWGHTTFYKDENITPVNWYGGVGILATFLTAYIPPPGSVATVAANTGGGATFFGDNVANMVGINGILHVYGMDLIGAIGTQWAWGNNASNWTNTKKIWIGLGFGFNVLKLTAPNGGV